MHSITHANQKYVLLSGTLGMDPQKNFKALLRDKDLNKCRHRLIYSLEVDTERCQLFPNQSRNIMEIPNT